MVYWSCVLLIESLVHTAGVFDLFFVESISLICRSNLFLSGNNADRLPEFAQFGTSVECGQLLSPIFHSILEIKEIYLGVHNGVLVVYFCLVPLLDQAGGFWLNVRFDFKNAAGGIDVRRSCV